MQALTFHGVKRFFHGLKDPMTPTRLRDGAGTRVPGDLWLGEVPLGFARAN